MSDTCEKEGFKSGRVALIISKSGGLAGGRSKALADCSRRVMAEGRRGRAAGVQPRRGGRVTVKGTQKGEEEEG